MEKKTQERVPNESKSVYEEVVKLTDEFCERHLDEEYAELARKLAAALPRDVQEEAFRLELIPFVP
ncbi:MAG: DUF6398 domain-containing protein [Blastocatellia bacterium]